MIYKDKKRVEKKVMSLLDQADKIKAITKTRFLNELEKLKGKDKFFSYVFSDLEGKDVENLKKQLKERLEEHVFDIQRREAQIIRNILMKSKDNHTVLVSRNNSLTKYLKKKKIKKKINFVTNFDKHEHIDLALVAADKIDSDANILVNKSSRSIIDKANKLDIPVYCYIHSWNFVPKLKGNAIVKPESVKSIISDIGIFEPEVFVQEVKLSY